MKLEILNRPCGLGTTSLHLLILIVSSFVSNSLSLPITEQSQVEVIQDPLPSFTSETKDITAPEGIQSPLKALNFPHTLLAPGGLLPVEFIREYTNLPELKSTVETDSVQESPNLELLRRIIPLVPSNFMGESEEEESRPLTPTEVQEIPVAPVVKAEEQISPEIPAESESNTAVSTASESKETVESKEATNSDAATSSVDKESFNNLETLEEETNNNVNLPAKTEDTVSLSQQVASAQQFTHSNDTKILFFLNTTAAAAALNNVINAGANAINDFTQVVGGKILTVPQPLFSALNPLKEIEADKTSDTKSVETPASAEILVAVPSEVEVDDVRTPESSLAAHNNPEVNEKAALETTSSLEDSVVVEESPIDIISAAIPLIPDYISPQKQRISTEDNSAVYDLDPMSLVIPILPSLPAETAVVSKNVRTGQLTESEDLTSTSITSSQGSNSNLRLTMANPIPLLASSPLFREPLAVLSQQAERFRPFMKYVSSHVPSFSVDPFNINNREAPQAETQDDLSAFFYLQDDSNPLTHVIPLLRGRNQIKSQVVPEAATAVDVPTPTNKAAVESVANDEVSSGSSPVTSDADQKNVAEVNSQEPAESVAALEPEITQPDVAVEVNNEAIKENSSAETLVNQDKNQEAAVSDDGSAKNEQNEPVQSNSQYSPSPSSTATDSKDTSNAATTSASQSPTSPAVETTNTNAPQTSNTNKPLSSRPTSNSNTAANKPPRPAFGIQSSSSSSNQPSASADAAATPPARPPRPFSIPGILLNPIEALGWQIPSFQWPSFSQMLRRLFGRNDPNNINNRHRNAPETPSVYEKLRFGIEFEDFCGEADEETVELKSVEAIEGNANDDSSKSMCQTDLPQGLASSACNKFCNQHGFTSGTCFNGENCVCDMVRDEGTFGLTFKRLADYGEISRMESLDLDEDQHDSQLESDDSELKCQRCSCSADCKKSGAYIGLCGNTCYCGLPWQTGSLTL